jgi:hypothetical protein
MRANEFLTEGKNYPVIVVDVQPEYSGINDGAESSVFPEIIKFVCNQTGPVLFFVNAEDQGLSGDTMLDVQHYWDDTMIELGYGKAEEEGEDENGEYYYTEKESPIDWRRFELVDKGYGFFRAYMDQGVPDATMIKMIRYLYQNKLNDARDLDYDDYVAIMGSDKLIDENFSINWTSVAQLKRFNGAYIVGGGRNECLREVELLMNAFNIRYRRIDSLVYG